MAKETLLEKGLSLEGEELDKWIVARSLEEKKALWVGAHEKLEEALAQLVEMWKEVCSEEAEDG